MTQIEPWQGDVATIDQTYGYNDWLLTPRALPGGDGQPAQVESFPVDSIQSSDVTGQANPSQGLVDDAITSARFLQPGDRLFRLPNGGVILRRSIFSDRCLDGDLSEERSLVMSEAAARAIAYFRSNGVVSDSAWCQAPTRGVPVGTTPVMMTPFNLSNPETVKDLRRVLQEIRAARSGDVSNSGLNAEFARTLANAVEPSELDRLDSAIETRITANMNFLERLVYHVHQLPWPLAVGIDLGGTMIGTAFIATIFHKVSEFWNGRGGPRGPQGPTGGSPTGGGGGERVPAPETATAERSALEMNSTAYWIGAVGAATLLAGIFHFSGRAREAEVRNGEVRVRETAEVRVRELAAEAPVARPRVEAREATTGGGIDFFRMMGAQAQPALAR